MPPEVDLQKVTEELNRALRLTLKDNRKSHYPYFTEAAADAVISTVHTCLTEFRPVIWPCVNSSMNTLYLKFRQGAQYVAEKMDPDFPNKMRLVKQTKLPRIGLRIAPKEGAIITARADIPWKADMERYLDDALPGAQPFERINLPLSDDDRTWIESTMYPLRDMFLVEVSRFRLLIVRLNKHTPLNATARNTGNAGEPRTANGQTTDGATSAADPSFPAP